MTREPRYVPESIEPRDMSEAEVRAFIAFLRVRSEKYWELHLAAEKERHPCAEGFKFEAKTFEDVERGLLWLIDGRDPDTGQRSGEK